ncbi:surface-adhesin E family protein [Phenylobacterium sp.]|jgi:hypothetical protein|uniref:surface-adhesin E family protein n=1 Tax=Phenylobacterium sp. TaxID=1871053 RepID=UPI002F40323B
MLRVRGSLIGALVAAVGVAGAAWGGAAPQPSDAPGFPESRSPDDLRAWIRRETDLDPDAVVAVTPGAVTAILSHMSTPEGPERVNLRSEATSAEAYAKDGVLSWSSVMVLDCKTGRARLGRTVAYAERNLVGEGRETVAAGPEWITPIPGGAAYNAMRKVCGGQAINPLDRPRPARAAQATPVQAPPATVAAPAPTPPPVVPPPRIEPAPPLRPAPPAPPPPPPQLPSPKSAPAPSRAAPKAAAAIVVAPASKVTSTHPVTFAPEPEPEPPSAPAAPLRPGRVSVQVSASPSAGEARQVLAAAALRAGGLPAGVSARVAKAVVRGRIYFRAQFTGFQTPADAEAFCRAAASRRGCLVKVNPAGRR